MKPRLSAIADINVSIAQVFNNFTRFGSPEPLCSRVLSAYVLWLFLLFIGSYTCNATLILTACSRDGVTVVADGLVLKPGGNPPSLKGCKIMQGTDDCFFSVAGVQDIRSIHYNLVPMADHACKSSRSLVERAKTFQETALPEVQRAWKYIKMHEPAAYTLMKRSGSARVSVVFSGGPPFTVAIVQFVEDSSGNMTVDNPMIDVSNPTSQTAYESVGASENVEVYSRQHPEIERLDDAGFLRGLLLGAIQLEREPKRIGPPVAILEINRTGARWVEQGACAEIKHHSKPNPKRKSASSKITHSVPQLRDATHF